MSDAPLSIERYAEAVVYCREYPPAVRPAVLLRLGTTPVLLEAEIARVRGGGR